MILGVSGQTWFQPVNNWSVVIAVAVILAATMLIYRLRFSHKSRIRLPSRLFMYGLRVIIIALLSLALIDWTQYKVVTQPAELVIVFDQSKSGAHVDSSLFIEPDEINQLDLGGPSRFNTGKYFFLKEDLKLIKSLQRDYRLRFASIGSSVEHFSVKTDKKIEQWLRGKQAFDGQSRIGDGLQEVIRYQAGRSTAGVVCLTDGINTHGQSIDEATQFAKRNNIPLFFVGWGEATRPTDVSIGDLKYSKTVFLGDIIQVNTRINAVNLDDEKVVVHLIDNNSNEIVDKREVDIDQQYFETNVPLNAIGKIAGTKNFRIEIVPHKDESTIDNNVAEISVNVRDEQIRVLMLHNYPSNEFRFLKSLISRQRSSDGAKKAFYLRTLMQQSEPRHPEIDEFELETFPGTAEKLRDYDVIIIGDIKRGSSFSRSHLNDQQLGLIRDFVVKDGGRIIFVGGPRFLPGNFMDSPISDLFPFGNGENVSKTIAERKDPIRLKPTDFASAFPPFIFNIDQQSNERIFSQLPKVNWWQKLPELKYGTIVLAESLQDDNSTTESYPLMTFQVVNSGRVVYHATDETYQWRRLAGDRYYGRYWLQLIRFLCRRDLDMNDNGTISIDKELFIEHEEVEVTVELPDSLLNMRETKVASDSIDLMLYRDNQPFRVITIRNHGRLDGAYVGQIQGLPPGVYRIQLKTAIGTSIDEGVKFEVSAANRESKNLVLQERLLQKCAEQSGGQYFHLSDMDQVWDNLPVGEQTILERMPPRSAWVDSRLGFAFACAIITFMTIEWVIRKRNGLV